MTTLADNAITEFYTRAGARTDDEKMKALESELGSRDYYVSSTEPNPLGVMEWEWLSLKGFIEPDYE